MRHRYAVLWDIDGDESRPAGIAVERGDHVYVDVAEEYGIPKRYTGRYRVLQPDSTDIVYEPRDPLYFEQVLVELSRVFAVGGRGEIDSVDSGTLMRLLNEKVHRPRNRARVGTYEPSKLQIFSGAAERESVYAPDRSVRIAARADASSAA